tara:strand:- start:3903 stop:4385 length:483 start_codon:yes stop_codon:yes gene_type:complete
MKMAIAKRILGWTSSKQGIAMIEEVAARQGKTPAKLIKMATNKVAKGNAITVSTADDVLAGYTENARGFATANPLQSELVKNSIQEATIARQSFGIREADFAEWMQRHAKKMGINAPKYSGGKQQLIQERRILDETQERQRVVKGWRPDNPFFDELKGKK